MSALSIISGMQRLKAELAALEKENGELSARVAEAQQPSADSLQNHASVFLTIAWCSKRCPAFRHACFVAARPSSAIIKMYFIDTSLPK